MPKVRSGLAAAITATLAAILVVLSCTDDPAGPRGVVTHFGVAPWFASAAASIVPIDSVRLTLRRVADNSIVKDSTVAMTGDSLDLTLRVALTSRGETFTLTIAALTPEGTVAFEGGPVTVSPATTGEPAIVDVELEYVGPGSDAVEVVILDFAPSVRMAETVLLTAIAEDDDGEPIPGTPIAWRSLDPDRATVPNRAVGEILAGTLRGPVEIVAELLTGLTTAVTLEVLPVPSVVQAESGSGQTGVRGSTLPEPLVARVLAPDEEGVEGVWVRFEATAGGGTVTPDSALTDPEGRASATLTLGPEEGTNTVLAAVVRAPDDVITTTFTATASEAGAEGIWTWISGRSSVNQAGVYGTQGSPDPANVPGAREGAVSWIDDSGNLWLFGGPGRDAAGAVGILNDLWRFDGSNWAWISGSSSIDQAGVYGTQGSPDPANVPGARTEAVSWTDGSGNLWLFGGTGHDAAGNFGFLNDLWRFDGTNWTWISGSSSIDQAGVYGTQGSPDPANVPGAREDAVSWIDGSGNLWLFGGAGPDAGGNIGLLNDLWRFDGTNWTWISGSSSRDQAGVYGTQGSPDPANVPGARYEAVSWIDGSGNLWLFGGDGNGPFNDLWRFDGTNWTWISGSSSTNQAGVYGTQGSPDPANVPGARFGAVSWTDGSGNLWLFGGWGGDAGANIGSLNDLWRFEP